MKGLSKIKLVGFTALALSISACEDAVVTPFSLSVSPNELTLSPGESDQVVVSANFGGQMINVSVDMSEADALTFNLPSTIGPTTNAVVKARNNAQAGDYSIKVRAIIGDQVREATLFVTINSSTPTNPPDFDLNLTPSATATAGTTVKLSAFVNAKNGFSGVVVGNLTSSNPKISNASAFANLSAGGAGQMEFSVNIASDTPAGTYDLNLQATGANVVKTGVIRLTVNPASTGTFRATLSPRTITLKPSRTGFATLTITPEEGFNARISIDCTSSLDTIACDSQPTSLIVNTEQQVQIAVSVPAGVAQDTYPMNIRLAGGGTTRFLTLNVTVSAP